jgi:hypothetical protein
VAAAENASRTAAAEANLCIVCFWGIAISVKGHYYNVNVIGQVLTASGKSKLRNIEEAVVRFSHVAAAIMLLFAPVVHAQTSTGEVNGTVTDAQGGAVPKATVKLTSETTRIETVRTTNESGAFVFVNVQPGTYVLHVTQPGFKEANISAFTVGVSQAVTLNVKLDVGAVAETVEVTGAAPLIQTTTTELGTVIPRKVVNDLPLNGRNFTQLLTLTPGVTPVSTSQNRTVGCCEGNVGIPGSGFSDPSFHGQQNRSKLYFFDGIINTNIRGPTYIVIPNIDLIQEFMVVGHDAKAEFGGATGGVVNMVSRSGGNSIHGSAFEYVRNNFFDARDTFKDAKRTGPAAFRQNQFGAVITGPVIKNKTFFSGGYDGWRYSQPTQALSYVPTAAEISGDFTNFAVVQGHNLYNPYSTRASGSGFVRDPFRCDGSGNPLPVDAQKRQDQSAGTPCNKLPAALIYAPMQQFFQQYAGTANYAAAGDLTHNFIQSRGTTNNSNSFQARIDHRLNDKDSLFFRYTEQRVTSFTPIGEVGSTAGGSQGRNYGGGWIHIFNPSVIMDVRAGYAGRPGVDASQQNQHSAGLEPLKKFGFTDIDKYNGMLVNLATTEWTNGGNNSFGIRGDAPRENPNWSISPNLTWIRGNHNVRAGFWFIDAKRIQENTFQTYTFADDQTGDPTKAAGTTGLSLASALLGFPTNFQGQLPVLGGGPVKFKYAAWAAYVQDEWRLRPGLTVSLGLRYDALTQPKTLDGRLWNALDIPNQRWIIGASAMPPLCSVAKASPCIPDAFQSDPHFGNVVLAGKSFFAPAPVRDNWGPRVGVAWRLTNNTVLRAGYGLYWDAVPARSQYAQNDLELAVWPAATAFSGNVNTTGDFANGGQKLITDIQGHFPTPLPPTNPWTPTNTFGDDPRIKDPYSQQWQFEIQRELTTSTMFSVAYAGSSNGRLPYTGLANAARQASPNGTPAAQIDALRAMPWLNANITYTQSIGYSRYNALEAKFERRFSRGLHSLISYTWGKSTDISSGYFNVENGPGGGSTVQNYYDQSTARGVSGYDVTQFLSWATLYEFPAGRGKRWLTSGPASWVLGNWQLNYILQARSGQPYNLTVNGDVANLRGSAPNIGNYARPNIIANPFQAGPVAANPDPGCRTTLSQGGKAADIVGNSATWFNPCAFAVPSASFGNLGRNAFRGPAVFNMDVSLFKSIPLKESYSLQLRFEAFNALNVQNWDVPSGTTIGAGNAGQITALAAGTTPRQLQFGLRFEF